MPSAAGRLRPAKEPCPDGAGQLAGRVAAQRRAARGTARVRPDNQRWLVAPYGAVTWVLNARAAGRVTLRRGRDRQDCTIRELPAAESGPILQRYIRIAPATRPYFQAGKAARAKVAAWIEDYNTARKHSALGMRGPLAYELAPAAGKVA